MNPSQDRILLSSSKRSRRNAAPVAFSSHRFRTQCPDANTSMGSSVANQVSGELPASWSAWQLTQIHSVRRMINPVVLRCARSVICLLYPSAASPYPGPTILSNRNPSTPPPSPTTNSGWPWDVLLSPADRLVSGQGVRVPRSS